MRKPPYRLAKYAHVIQGNAADALVGTTLCVGVIGQGKRSVETIIRLTTFQECTIVALEVVVSCL